MTKETELVIQAVKSKIKANQITDPGTESEVKWVIESDVYKRQYTWSL